MVDITILLQIEQDRSVGTPIGTNEAIMVAIAIFSVFAVVSSSLEDNKASSIYEDRSLGNLVSV